jgi:predicted metal-dependent hydrolase
MPRESRYPCSIQLDGESIDFQVVRVGGRKHLHLCVDRQARLEVRVPYHCSVQEAEQAVWRKRQWVIGTLREARARMAPALGHGSVLPLLDERLLVAVSPLGRRGVSCDNGRLGVRGVDPADAQALAEALRRWYRRRAEDILPPRVRELARHMALSPGDIRIRAQKTRWGSCSARGTISLNWRLLLLPRELCDYVVVHELCHLRHLNHSARFWATVEQYCPDWRARRRYLNRHALHALPL